jgi:copper chaperone CopZ
MTGSETFQLTGLTCGHCANAVTGELTSLTGVFSVHVELVPGGESLVTLVSEQPLDRQAIAAALEKAGGYQLAGA